MEMGMDEMEMEMEMERENNRNFIVHLMGPLERRIYDSTKIALSALLGESCGTLKHEVVCK